MGRRAHVRGRKVRIRIIIGKPMNRKQRRAAAKQSKQAGQEEVAEKIALFGLMPDHCLTCEEPFDKTNKEMVEAKVWGVEAKVWDVETIFLGVEAIF